MERRLEREALASLLALLLVAGAGGWLRLVARWREAFALAVAEEFMGANWTAVEGHLWGEDYALFVFRGFARVNGTDYCLAFVEVNATARRAVSAELHECGEGGRTLRLRG